MVILATWFKNIFSLILILSELKMYTTTLESRLLHFSYSLKVTSNVFAFMSLQPTLQTGEVLFKAQA